MRTKQGYIIVIVVMLCVAGLCTYGLQGVIEEQQSPLWIEAAPTTQQDWILAVQPMQGVRHNFTPTATYTPSAAISTPSMRSAGSSSYMLPTLSGSTARSYGGSTGYGQMGNVVAHTPQADVALPMAQVNPLAHRATAVQPIQMAPRQNRMLAQGRAQATGMYGGSTANGNKTGTYAGSGPMKAPPTMGGATWQSWYDAYLAATGKGFVTEGDQADFLAWWNANYGGEGYGPNMWGDFWSWVPKGETVPVTDGMSVLLILLLGYVVYKQRLLTTK